jgi:hypothetical protein
LIFGEDGLGVARSASAAFYVARSLSAAAWTISLMETTKHSPVQSTAVQVVKRSLPCTRTVRWSGRTRARWWSGGRSLSRTPKSWVSSPQPWTGQSADQPLPIPGHVCLCLHSPQWPQSGIREESRGPPPPRADGQSISKPPSGDEKQGIRGFLARFRHQNGNVGTVNRRDLDRPFHRRENEWTRAQREDQGRQIRLGIRIFDKPW